ncbi:MAG: MBL fold metallo-hydrolase, partial [Bryobacterales bacterium]|nr:MBL fold metallo-hydrolase [Bryobacterales bacterium]
RHSALRRTAACLGLLAIVLVTPVSSKGQSMRVTLLGTGTPNPHPERFGPATLVEAGSQRLLFDAGRGVTIRLNQLGIPMREVTAVFITHFHSDHLVGLADLWLIGWLPPNYGRRQTPLRIWGPLGLSKITAGMEEAYSTDIAIRVKDEALPRSAAKFDVNEYTEGGVIYEHAGVAVTSFEVNHGELIKPAYGYRVDYAGRSVVISGDTRFDQNVIKAAKGADLLVHEVVAIPEALFAVNPAMKRVEAHHTTAEEVGTVMSEAKPRLGVLTHYVLTSGPGIPPATKEEVLDRVKTRYSGPVVAGHDLMAIEVGESVSVVSPQ